MLKYKKILFTGSSGRFGSVFKKINKKSNYLYPSKKQLNITNKKSVENYFNKKKINLVVHAAALSRPMDLHENNISKSISTNIIGTSNLVNECYKKKIKIVYISTNYVYPGVKGNYKETSNLNPINNYAWSKLGGECAVMMYKNSLILRVCMTERPFIHKSAFSNLKTNFIYHDQVAKFLPKLFKYKGILNVGGKIRTVYKFARRSNPKIKAKKFIKKSKLLKINTSMNINKLRRILTNKRFVL